MYWPSWNQVLLNNFLLWLKASEMTKNTKSNKGHNSPLLVKQVNAKVALKLKANRKKNAGVWFGLGTMGIIGWSIAVPTLMGVGLGIWLDQRYGEQRSWTLALLLAGLAIGCLTAWNWISKEYASMHDDSDDKGDT